MRLSGRSSASLNLRRPCSSRRRSTGPAKRRGLHSFEIRSAPTAGTGWISCRSGSEPLAGVLSTLVAQGGKVVDTWPRDGDNDAAFGQVVSEPEFAETLFVTTKIDRPGKEAGLAQFRDTQRAYRRDRLDLVQI